jgi:hypothetical protein
MRGTSGSGAGLTSMSPMESRMSTLTKSLLASIAAVGLLAGCATYDYGYGYSQPYYGYGYDYGPSYYDYGSYYGPGYYVGPSVGLNFGFRDRGGHERAGRRHVGSRSYARSYSSPRVATRSASSGTRNGTFTRSRARAPTVARAQGNRGGARGGSQQVRSGSQQARAEQQ